VPIAAKPSHHKKFRADIQALRAFAVASVVLYHLWPERLVGGFTGVDIFFVISGYLMTTSIMGKLQPLLDSRSVTPRSVFRLLAEFYARRIRRLVPAALTTLVGVLGLTYATGNFNMIISNAKDVVASATFWENWRLASKSVDYLHQGDAPVATQHFWSLSLEEQFYAMWPLLLILASLVTLSVVIYYKKSKVSGAVIPITLLALVSVAYGYWLTQHEPSIAYFSTPARIWELMLGGIIAFLPVIKNYDLKLLLPHVGLAMCLYSVFFIGSDGFPGWHALIPTIGAVLIILGGVGRAESRLSFDKLFSVRPVQWIGDISYSIYLWHFPFIVILPVLFKLDMDGPHAKLFKLGIIVASLAAAHLSYKFVEEPTRRTNLKLRYVYLLFILATGLVAAGGLGMKYLGEHQADARLRTMHAAAMNTTDDCFGARAILHQDKCPDPYGKTNPAYMAIGESDIYLQVLSNDAKWCAGHFDEFASNQNKFCVVGDKSAKKSIVLFGDSHAQHYINAFDVIGRELHYKVYLYDYTGCTGANPDPHETCAKRLAAIKKHAGTFKQADLVVISFMYHNADFMARNIAYVKSVTKTKVALLEDNAHSTIAKFNNCYVLEKDCTISKKAATEKAATITRKLIDSGAIKQSEVIPTDDFFCSGKTCYSSIGDVPVYFNTSAGANINSHITASYSYSLAPLLEQKLQAAGYLSFTQIVSMVSVYNLYT